MELKIAIYVNSTFAKANYKSESYNMRLFAGIEIIRDVLTRNGYSVEYCSEYSVTSYDIILVSITAQCGWFSFIKERLRWPNGKYKAVKKNTLYKYFDIDSLMGMFELKNYPVRYLNGYVENKKIMKDAAFKQGFN